jgi:sperm-associated antigen 1
MDESKADDLLRGLSGSSKTENEEDVPIEHLDYEYVKRCKDPNQLRRILAVLKSGKEGKYEALEREVEDSLLKTLSPTERETWIAQNREPTRADKNFAANLVDGFLREINNTNSQTLLKKEGNIGGEELIQPNISAPVRGSKVVKKVTSSASSIQQNIQPVSAMAAPVIPEPVKKRDTKAEPFNSYYKKWEQFDVDKAINEAEETLANDDRIKDTTKSKPGSIKIEEIPYEKPVKKTSIGSSASLPLSVPTSSNTNNNSQSTNSLAAKREKEKGNECFRAGEFEDASNFYTRALRLEEPNTESYALLLSNRAQARLKLNQWESAEDDCNLSLNIGKGVIFKTLLRRAQARLKRGRWAEAVSDCRRVMNEFSNEKGASLEASKIEAEALVKAKTAGMPLNEAEKTHVPPTEVNRATNTRVGKRVMIEEEDDEQEKTTISSEKISSPLVSLGSSARKLIIEEEDEEEEIEKTVEVPIPVKNETYRPAPTKADVPVPVKFDAPPHPVPVKVAAPQPAPVKNETFQLAPVKGAVPVPVKVDPPTLAKEEPPSPKRVERVRRLGLATEEREQGNLLFGKGLLVEAKDAYTRAAELDPNDFSSFSNRAQVHLKLNDLNGAIADATIALNLLGVKSDTAALSNSNEEAIAVKALFRRATAFKAKKDYASAIADLTTALALAPDSEKVLAELRELKSLSKNIDGQKISSSSTVTSPIQKSAKETSAVHLPVTVIESPKQAAASPQSTSTQPIVSPATARATASALAAKATKTLLSSSVVSSNNSPMTVPQTANALNQAWKLRKRDPPALLSYMKQLSGTTVCDLFKTPAEVDLVSGIIDGLKIALTMTQPSREDLEWLIDFLDGLSHSIGFSMISSMLDTKDKKNVLELISLAEKDGVTKSATSKVLDAFGVAR